MDLRTILNKVVDGAKMLLVQPTMIFRVLGDESLQTLHVVDSDEAGRPDLIADKYYGDHRMVDIILKYNRISDPFSIRAGETLRIPKYTIAYYKLERPSYSEDLNLVKQQFIDTKRLPANDQAKIERLKKKYGKDELLPPNVIPSGKKTYEFDGQAVRLGKQAQTAAVTTSTTMSNFNDNELISNLDTKTLASGDLSLDIALTSDPIIRNTEVETSTNGADITGDNNIDGGNPQGTGNADEVSPDSPCSK